MPDKILFTHKLDSQNSFGIADCGAFLALPNGDELETGVMPRPDLPAAPVRDYEEVWRGLSFSLMEGSSGLSFVLKSVSGDMDLSEGEEKEIICMFIGAIWGTYIVF